MWSSNSTSGNILKITESKDSNVYTHVYTHACSTIIHNNQVIEATQVFINPSKDKESMAMQQNII